MILRGHKKWRERERERALNLGLTAAATAKCRVIPLPKCMAHRDRTE